MVIGAPSICFIIQPILASLTPNLTLMSTALARPGITTVSNIDIRKHYLASWINYPVTKWYKKYMLPFPASGVRLVVQKQTHSVTSLKTHYFFMSEVCFLNAKPVRRSRWSGPVWSEVFITLKQSEKVKIILNQFCLPSGRGFPTNILVINCFLT